MELQLRKFSCTSADGALTIRADSVVIPMGVCGLLGGAGAGKTTLLRVLAGAATASSGSVARVQDIDLLAPADAARRAVGLLPQAATPACHAPADDVLNHHALQRGIPGYQARRDIVELLLRQVGLWEEHRQPLDTFSDGMRRRFALAVALLGRPPLLLLDAPTAGLDAEERQRLLELVAPLGQHHVVLLATRDADDVAAACSCVALLEQGEVRLAGTLPTATGPELPVAAARPAAAA